MSYRTYRSSLKGNTLVNTPGMVLYVPYAQNTSIKCGDLVEGVHVGAVALFASNRRLGFAARGVQQTEVRVFLVFLI